MTANTKTNTLNGFADGKSISATPSVMEIEATPLLANDSSVEPSQLTSGSEKLDRVREIIFGQQNREYSQHFDKMDRDITRLQQDIHRLNEQLLVQKQAHGQQVQELNLQFTQKLKALEEQQQIKYTEVDKKQSKDIQDLQSIVHRMQDELYTEIGQVSERLGAEKTDRAVLGDLLIELGTNLREDSSNGLVAGILENLDEGLSQQL